MTGAIPLARISSPNKTARGEGIPATSIGETQLDREAVKCLIQRSPCVSTASKCLVQPGKRGSPQEECWRQRYHQRLIEVQGNLGTQPSSVDAVSLRIDVRLW